MKTLLETQRLFIRPLAIDEMISISSSNANTFETSIELNAISEIVKTAIVKKIMKMRNIDSDLHEFYTYWLIIDKECGHGIGFIGFKGFDDDGCLEVGYSISPDHRKKRLMTEALEAFDNWALEYQNVKGITAKVQKTNIGSIKVLQNCSFEPVGFSETEIFYRFIKGAVS